MDKPSPLPHVLTRLQQFREARKNAQELIKKAQTLWIKHRDTPRYREGDQVWLEGKHLRTNQPTAKLAARRHGPFEIIQVLSPVNYRLKLPTQWSIHPVFHIDLLTPYHETALHGENFQHPPPDLVEGEEEYEVEKILDSRRFGRRRKLQYLIKWKGYSDLDNQWVDKDDVYADQAIAEFEREQSRDKSRGNVAKSTSSFQPGFLTHPTMSLPTASITSTLASHGIHNITHQELHEALDTIQSIED